MYKNKTKKLWYLYIVLVLIILIVISYFLYKRWNNNNNFIKTYFQVIDNYTTKDVTMEKLNDIYSQPDFFTNLSNFNNELLNNLEYQFIEFQVNPIGLIGHWDKPFNLANGYGHKDLTNQKIEIEGKQLEATPVNAIQLGKESQIPLLHKKIFQENDFQQQENNISLILGNNFKSYYKIGDKIKFAYIDKLWIGTVTNFLDKQTKIEMDSLITYNLDNFIIMLFLEQLSTKNNSHYDKDFKINYYINKNCGYIILKNKEEYKTAKNYIEDMSKKYDLKYTVLRGY